MIGLMRIREFRRVRGGDEGFTLIELLVSMIVVSLLGAAIVASLSSFTRSAITTTSRVRASQQGTVITDRLTKAIRAASGATQVGAADVNSVTLYVDYTDTNGPRKLAFYTTGGPVNAVFHEDTTLADASGTYTGATTAKSDGNDVNLSGGGIFTYFNSAGATLSTPVSAANLTAIASIGIKLVTQEPGLSTPVTSTTRVYLRNVEYK